MSASDTIALPEVSSQEGALIGDENLPDAREPDVSVNTDSVDAQVVAQPGPPVTQVYVHETSVRLDEVITDPSSPLAVQVPDAGRGSLVLPIHALDAPRPEDVFAEAKSVEITDEDRTQAAQEGRTAADVAESNQKSDS